MGRRRSSSSSVSKTVANSVDSSPSSAECSFRELDDVFLQKQTRIWLGEVVKSRLDEQLSLSDLLADGVLLFEVSKMVWNMLLEKCMELRQIKAYQCPLGSRKSSGRYMPYSNVDSFLKVCKILGLNGIDLFSPSDVVEKRNIRKVCICIRALSKKARSKQLYVPDFDLVTYTVVMPTDMVGCIRRSLESSQCSISSSSSCNSYKGKRSKSQRKNLISAYSRNYDSCSEESDEAESAYSGIESYSSSTGKFDYPVTLNSENENSPGAFSVVKNYTARKAASQSDTRNLHRNDLAKHCSLHHSRDDHQANYSSTCHSKAHEDLHHRAFHTDNDVRHNYKNSSQLADVDLALGTDASDIGASLFESGADRDFIADYLAFSDSIVLRNDGNSPVLFDGEDSICNFFMSIDSHGIDSKRKTFQNGFYQRSTDDMEDVEVSSMTSMSSILGRVLNMDFDDQYNAGDSSTVQVHFLENDTDNQDKSSFLEDQTSDSAQYEILSQCSGTYIKESESDMKLESGGLCTNFLSHCQDNGQSCIMESKKCDLYGDSQIHTGNVLTVKSDLDPADDKVQFRCKDLEKSVLGTSELNPDLEHGNNHSLVGSLHNKIFQEEQVSRNKCLIEGSSEDGNECDKYPNNPGISAENVLDGKMLPQGDLQKDRIPRRSLLKTLVKGTTLVGVLFLLLHMRRRGKGENDKPQKPLKTRRFEGAKSASQIEQSSRGIYPAGKLKFAN
ncbi:hypothetical protein ACH5RR_012872 [Cinchona calisaya]|uniref:Calponin-homology (CH) domain-containing protein n=1 Tax=Cinchona calisaya TaxID=153742 RepID=A0ABD3A8Z0_9GENT